MGLNWRCTVYCGRHFIVQATVGEGEEIYHREKVSEAGSESFVLREFLAAGTDYCSGLKLSGRIFGAQKEPCKVSGYLSKR